MNSKEAQLHTKGWLTESISSILDTDQKLYGCYYYDYYHNLIQTRNTDMNGKIIVSKSAFNFRSQSIATSEEYGEDIDIRKSYLYDHAERLVKESHNIGKKTTHFAYSYDELGKIRSLTRIHGKDSLVTVNEYNIRDWLIKIQSPAFKQQLHYTDGAGTPCYNGNISSMTWQNDSELIRGYSFSYDKLARLKNAIYGEGENLDQNSGNYNEQVIDYDRMGNILGLLRYGQTSEANHGLIDNLHLTYDGNCLQSVYDNATNQAVGNSMEFKNGANETVEYEYDSNGNLTKDLNKKISCIQYNILNLPSRVLFEDGNSISYMYDANGTKLRTTHITENEAAIADYIGSAIYENGVLTKLLTNQGYITLTDTVYHYFIQDHQGNNRAIVAQDGTVEEVNHYYPFGGVFDSTPNVQPYKYNGKELDRRLGLNWYDYGARMYDAAIGRWHVMDPLAEKYYNSSPYIYCNSNPINYIDPFGMDYWSTNDPNEIKRFMNTLNSFPSAAGNLFESVDFSSWNHSTDAEFLANLTFNDQTNMFYSSYGTFEKGVLTSVGVSFPAVSNDGKNAFIEGLKNGYIETMAKDQPLVKWLQAAIKTKDTFKAFAAVMSEGIWSHGKILNDIKVLIEAEFCLCYIILIDDEWVDNYEWIRVSGYAEALSVGITLTDEYALRRFPSLLMGTMRNSVYDLAQDKTRQVEKKQLQ